MATAAPPRGANPFGDSGVHYLVSVRHQCFADNFVVAIHRELALFHHDLQERRHVGAVHLARVRRY